MGYSCFLPGEEEWSFMYLCLILDLAQIADRQHNDRVRLLCTSSRSNLPHLAINEFWKVGRSASASLGSMLHGAQGTQTGR